jgi:hypothetical protein
MTREEIEAFFKDAIVEGISRKVVFLENPEEGRIEVDLICPPHARNATSHYTYQLS